jgi:hypothetical protein
LPAERLCNAISRARPNLLGIRCGESTGERMKIAVADAAVLFASVSHATCFAVDAEMFFDGRDALEGIVEAG